MHGPTATSPSTSSSTSSTSLLPPGATVILGTTPELVRRADLLEFDVVHQALRLQLRALVLALEGLDVTRSDGAEEVRRWFGSVLGVIRHHHHMEDDVIFPLMAAAEPSAADTHRAMTADHESIERTLQALAWALEALERAGHIAGVPPEVTRAAAVQAARELAAVVDAHLDAEEATTVPVLLARVARSDYLAATHAAIHATGADGDIKLFAFVAPWLLPACTPDQIERVYAKLPRMVRHVNRFVWVPRYERAFPRLVTALAQAISELQPTTVASSDSRERSPADQPRGDRAGAARVSLVVAAA